MPRRLAATMGVLAATLVLAVGAPASAHAATGILVVDRQLFVDPSGCVQVPESNDTGADAEWASGQQRFVTAAKSVLILNDLF